MSHKDIGSLVKELENNYITGTTTTSKYVDYSLSETIDTIYAYLRSKHITGPQDSMGRDKPFFNIVTAAVNIWYRATDIDRKNIRIKPKKRSDVLKAFIATVHLQDFMRREDFGTFLNQWGRSLASFGSSVLKFIDKGDRLHAEVIPWNRLIVDAVSFEDNPVIEKLELTPAQLRQNPAYDQDVVEGLLNAISQRETIDGQHKDNLSNYIELYEVHGELPLSYLTGEEKDDTTYVQQMHVISCVQKEGKKGKDPEYDTFTLFSGKEKNPYMITHLIKEDGQTLSIGAVEHLFEAQWMVNHSTKAIKDQLDLASKLIFQTADKNYVGRNALTAIETGDILIHDDNKPLTQLANNSHDVTALQNFGQQWQLLAKEITSTPDAIAGNTFPSGTAYRQVVALQQEAHSLFEIMTENKGLAIEQMMRTYIIPFIKRKMDSTDEIVATLDEQGIKKIDSVYIPNEAVKRANQRVIEKALEGEPTDEEQFQGILAEETEKIKKAFAQDGNERFFKPSEITNKTWKESLKDLEWDIEVEVTNETTDKEAMMTTLTTVLQSIAGNPAVLQDPNMKMLFNKILVATGEVSPIELSAGEAPQQQPQLAEGQQVPSELAKVGGGL